MDGRHHLCPLEPFDFKRLAKALPGEAPITWRRWNAHSGKSGWVAPKASYPGGPIWSQPTARAQRVPGRGISGMGPLGGEAHGLWNELGWRERQACGVEVMGSERAQVWAGERSLHTGATPAVGHVTLSDEEQMWEPWEESKSASLWPCRGLCLPGLVAACPGDPESEDEAQPPPVLRAVALLRPWLCHRSVHSGWWVSWGWCPSPCPLSGFRSHGRSRAVLSKTVH